MTQEVFDYIDSAPGNGFNEKFENIILEAKRGESDRKAELARLDGEIEKQWKIAKKEWNAKEQKIPEALGVQEKDILFLQ